MARHSMLRRPTAVKILSGELVNTENVARFEREVQLTSQLTHPSTIAIYDYGRNQSGVFYYAMEFLDGMTLGELLEKEGAQPPARTVGILVKVCGSLQEAHEVGLIHRDIKPANIMICRQGTRRDVVKVLDFGLVKDVSDDSDVRLTSPEVIKGTPVYIAPERIRDPLRTDARTDIYALGGVAFALLTGHELYEGGTASQLLAKALESEPVWPKDADPAIPDGLRELVMRCVARDPEERPASMEELAEALDDLGIAKWSQEDARAAWAPYDAEAAEA